MQPAPHSQCHPGKEVFGTELPKVHCMFSEFLNCGILFVLSPPKLSTEEVQICYFNPDVQYKTYEIA